MDKRSKLSTLLQKHYSETFSGKLNFLTYEGQYKGHLVYRDGMVVGGQFDQTLEMRFVLEELYLLWINCEIEAVAEPELSNLINTGISLNPVEIEQRISGHFAFRGSLSYPDMELYLKINPGFIKAGEILSEQEYSIFMLIKNCIKIKEIYNKSNYPFLLTTWALNSLRRKKAILVLKERM